MAEPIYLGVDASWTATTLVTLSLDGDAETLEVANLGTEKKDWPNQYARLHWIGEQFMAVLDNAQPSMIAIEGYSHGSAHNCHMMGELGAHLRWLMHKGGYPFFIASPSSLKKFVVGKGNAAKQLMIMNAFKKWGFEAPDDDVCDAYCLARMMWQLDTKSTLKLTKDLRKTLEEVACAA